MKSPKKAEKPHTLREITGPGAFLFSSIGSRKQDNEKTTVAQQDDLPGEIVIWKETCYDAVGKEDTVRKILQEQKR